MHEGVTTALDALGLLLVAVGVGVLVWVWVGGVLGVGAGLLVAGVVVLAGSAVSSWQATRVRSRAGL